jgi:hypothetical protein
MPAQTTIQVRRDTAANWTIANPTLAAGERGFETDTKLYKTGDGTTAWNSLDYENVSIQQWLNQGSNFAETMGRTAINTYQPSSGVLQLATFTPLISFTATQLTAVSAASSTPTAARMGLYSISGTTATLVAETADDPTLFSAGGTAYTRSFDTARGLPATYNLIAGQRYAFAVIVVGTMGSFVGQFNNSTGVSATRTLSPILSQVYGSQTDLATPRTLSGGATTVIYGRVS